MKYRNDRNSNSIPEMEGTVLIQAQDEIVSGTYRFTIEHVLYRRDNKIKRGFMPAVFNTNGKCDGVNGPVFIGESEYPYQLAEEWGKNCLVKMLARS